VQVGFFNAASHSRNFALVQKMSNFVTTQSSSPWGIYSFEDLNAGKKDLSHLGLDLKRTVLVDDNLQMILPEHQLNHLPVLSGHYDLFNDQIDQIHLNAEELIRNNLVFVAGFLSELLEMRERILNLDIRDAIQLLYEKMSNEESQESIDFYLRFFVKGRAILRTVNPSFEYWRLETSPQQMPKFILEVPVSTAEAS
jgi:hypothetical protein